MKFKISYAAILLSAIPSLVNCGALKKHFTKDGQSESIKIDGDSASESTASGSVQSSDSNASQVGHTESSSSASADVEQPAAPPSGSAGESEATDSAAGRKIVGDPVVVRIGRREIRRSQVLADMKKVPPKLAQRFPPGALFDAVKNQRLSKILLVSHGKELGLDRTKEFKSRLDEVSDDLISDAVLQKEIGSREISQPEIKARYTKYLLEYKKAKEFHILHIMTPTEQEANKVLASLAKGEDFSKLAKDKSVAQSKANGGDEGWIHIDMIPPELKDKIILLKNGDYTKTFLKTEAGYHIFLLQDMRDSSPYKYEEAEQTLRQEIMRDDMAKLINRLERQANVEKFNEDGSPVSSRNRSEPQPGQLKKS